MQPDWTHRTRIDRHGLWIKPGRILGVTARALRDHLERADQIHLCWVEDCTQPGVYHCKEFAAIDADSVIDLGAYGRLDSWRALVLLRKVLSGCLGCCSCRRTTEAPRQIQDQGVIRPLDPDSESEAEQIADPCEAVLIGLELQGKPRALAPEGCDDKAAAEPTRLLVDDLQLSDLGGRECARLCNHHSQLYMLSCQGRKCSVVSCFNKVHGAHKGTPLCSKHLAETGRSNSPAPLSMVRRNGSLRSPSSTLFEGANLLIPVLNLDPVEPSGSRNRVPRMSDTRGLVLLSTKNPPGPKGWRTQRLEHQFW